MIGGVDVVNPSVGDSASLEVLHHGSCSVNGRTLDSRTLNREISTPGAVIFRLGACAELFAYSDAQAEAAWDADRDDSPPNSMLYLIRSPNFITVVLDDPNAADMQAMLEEFRTILRGTSSVVAHRAGIPFPKLL